MGFDPKNTHDSGSGCIAINGRLKPSWLTDSGSPIAESITYRSSGSAGWRWRAIFGRLDTQLQLRQHRLADLRRVDEAVEVLQQQQRWLVAADTSHCSAARTTRVIAYLNKQKIPFALGRVPKKTAERFANNIDALLNERRCNLLLSSDVSKWIARLDQPLYDLLEARDLVEPRVKLTTLDKFIGSYIAVRTDVGERRAASAGIDLSNNDDYVRQTNYYWYDGLDRLTSMADYGSGDTTAGAGTWEFAPVPSRPGTAPASSSVTSLVTKYSYNTLTGAQEIVTDPSGMQSKTVVDDLGRTIYSSSNFHNFNESTEANTGNASDKSVDQVTKFIFNGADELKELVALDANADGNLSDNQSTKYLCENSVNASLVTDEIYPDSSDTTSSGSDQVKFTYNLAGDKTKSTDQRGTVIEYSFTNERRLELEKVTTLGSGVDGHVLSKKKSYDSLARLEKYTSYSASTGTGTIRNELQYAYDGLMNVATIYQSHEGAVYTSTSPKVVFDYDTSLSGGGSGDVYEYAHRRNQVTYPDGRVIYYDFDTPNPDYPFSKLSMVRRIRETNSSGTVLSEYSYNGTGRLAISDLAEPNVRLDHFQGTSGTYAGLDRFGRSKDLYWKGYDGTADVDRFRYGYDYAGNRKYTDIDSAIYAGNIRDEAYTYDSSHRPKSFDEGTLVGSAISGTPIQAQNWSLDALGNWSNYVKKASGTTSLNQKRTVNPSNEITDITETVGPSWVTIADRCARDISGQVIHNCRSPLVAPAASVGEQANAIETLSAPPQFRNSLDRSLSNCSNSVVQNVDQTFGGDVIR